MTLLRTIDETFASAAVPAVPIRELSARVRDIGPACTPETIRRELRATPGTGLRALESTDPMLETLSSACPPDARPAGLEAVVIDAGGRGLSPTPEDAVRVLGRSLGPRDRSARLRWARLLGELEPLRSTAPRSG